MPPRWVESNRERMEANARAAAAVLGGPMAQLLADAEGGPTVYEQARAQDLQNRSAAHRVYQGRDESQLLQMLWEVEQRLGSRNDREAERVRAVVDEAKFTYSIIERMRGHHGGSLWNYVQSVTAKTTFIRNIEELDNIRRIELYNLPATRIQAIARGKAGRTRVNTLYPPKYRTGRTGTPRDFSGPVYTLPRFTSGRIPNRIIQGRHSFPWVGNPSWDNEPTYPTHGYNTGDTTGYSEDTTGLL